MNRKTKPSAQHDDVTYIAYPKEDGLLHVEGVCFYKGNKYTYSLNEQKQPEKPSTGKFYLLRGRISLRSPSNGKVLQKKGPARRKIQNRLKADGREPSAESFSAKADLYLDTTNEKVIKEKVMEKAKKLAVKNATTLADVNNDLYAGKMPIPRAVQIYADIFLKQRKEKAHTSEETLRRSKRELENLAGLLDKYTMDAVPKEALSAAYKKLSEKRRGTIFRLAEQFWEYCRDRGIYSGENPFTTFLAGNPSHKKRNIEAQQKKAQQKDSLSEKEERRLNQMIAEADVDDLGATGVLLEKEGFTGSDVCKLSWDDVRFNQMGREETTAQIVIIKEFSAGSPHDYTKPVCSFSARELFRRAEELKSRGIDLKGRRILESSSGKRMTSKELATYCKEALLRCGVGPDALKPDPSSTNGAGSRLLQSHYHHHLRNNGIKDGSGISEFLLGHSLAGNVTYGHYCSMTSPEAQEHLLNLLDRNKTLEPVLPDEAVVSTERLEDGKEVMAVRAKEPWRFTQATVTVRLEPGQTLDVTSPGMIHGIAKAKAVK